MKDSVQKCIVHTENLIRKMRNDVVIKQKTIENNN